MLIAVERDIPGPTRATPQLSGQGILWIFLRQQEMPSELSQET